MSFDYEQALTAASLPSGIDATKIADGSVTSTEFQYINTLTSNAQTQLNAKVPYTGATTDINLNSRSITMPSGTIKDGSGIISFHPNNRSLMTVSGIPAVAYETYQLYGSGLSIAANWDTKVLNDNLGVESLNWEARTLTNPLGSLLFSWAGSDIFLSTNLDASSYTVSASQVTASSISNTFNQPVFDLSSFVAYDGSTVSAIAIGSRQLLDSTGSAVSIDWGSRQLADPGNNIVATWSSGTFSVGAPFEAVSTASFLDTATASSQTNIVEASASMLVNKKLLLQSGAYIFNRKVYAMNSGNYTTVQTNGAVSSSDNTRRITVNNAAGGSLTNYIGAEDNQRGRVGNIRTSGQFGSTDWSSKYRLYFNCSGVQTRTDFSTDSFAVAMGSHFNSTFITTGGYVHVSETAVPATANYIIGFRALAGNVTLFTKNGTGVTTFSSTLATLTDIYDIGQFVVESDGAGGLSLYRNGTLLGTHTGAPTIMTGSTSCGYGWQTSSGSFREFIVQGMGLTWE